MKVIRLEHQYTKLLTRMNAQAVAKILELLTKTGMPPATVITALIVLWGVNSMHDFADNVKEEMATFSSTVYGRVNMLDKRISLIEHRDQLLGLPLYNDKEGRTYLQRQILSGVESGENAPPPSI